MKSIGTMAKRGGAHRGTVAVFGYTTLAKATNSENTLNVLETAETTAIRITILTPDVMKTPI